MKTKKIDKKLVLSKQTIANLGNGKMNEIKGGKKPSGYFPTCGGTTCDLTGDPCLHCISVWPQVPSICICEH